MKKNVDELIIDHIEDVKKAANKYYRLVHEDRRGMVLKDDLISAGYVGLVEAAQ